MSARVISQQAMDPGVRLLEGYQALCREPDSRGHDPEVDGLRVGKKVVATWLGGWHEAWFHAHLDALEHNIAYHPKSLPAHWQRGIDKGTFDDLLRRVAEEEVEGLV
jgi:hypothetical protein